MTAPFPSAPFRGLLAAFLCRRWIATALVSALSSAPNLGCASAPDRRDLGDETEGGGLDADHQDPPDYAAKCSFACTPPSGVCAEEDGTDCRDTCIEETKNAPRVTCADCVVDSIDWVSTECTCGTTWCTECISSETEGGGPSCTQEGAPICEPHPLRCEGYYLAKAIDDDCRHLCEP